jgi:hypothetical protein
MKSPLLIIHFEEKDGIKQAPWQPFHLAKLPQTPGYTQKHIERMEFPHPYADEHEECLGTMAGAYRSF